MTKTKSTDKTKALVLLSGGLDSRLALKIMQEQNVEVEALFFLLPFGTGCCDEKCAFNFAQVSGIKLRVIDCTKGKLLKKCLEIIKKPKYGYGTAFNPCIDCRIFMFNLAREYADKHKIELIVTGEVLGERPMSQYKKALDTIEKESVLQGRLLRPLSAKLLPETQAEKKGLLNRAKFLNIHGRSRKRQIQLAKKYKISYPSPAGGCLLCEKNFAAKLKDLLENKKINDIDEQDIELLKIGRHFRNKGKIIVGRNEQENNKLEKIAKLTKEKNKYIILQVKSKKGPIVLIESKKDLKLASKLALAYSKIDVAVINLNNKKEFKVKKKDRKEFERYRI